MPRTATDWTHPVLSVGKIGHVQCLDIIRLGAGEGIKGVLRGVVRLSPMRRPLSLDARFDIWAFFQPHRHIYDNFIDFIKEGVDESQTLGSVSVASPGVGCLPGVEEAGTYPLWTIAGYNRIWNEYIRDPRDTVKMGDNFVPGNAAVKGAAVEDVREYGYPATHLPVYATTGNRSGVLSGADRELSMAVSGSAVKLDLPSLGQLRGRYNTEQERQWFSARYRDVMKSTWGVRVSTDQEARPTFLDEYTVWLSGYDVDGHDDASLGSYAGKAFREVSWPLRPFTPNEHGVVWIMGCMRYPPTFQNERDPLQGVADPSYKQLVSDPAIDSREPPMNTPSSFLFSDGADSVSLGAQPFGQWHRSKPARVHRRFETLKGFPIRPTPSSLDEAMYSWKYCDDIFANQSMAHWSLTSRFDMTGLIQTPGVTSGLFA